MSNVDNKPLSEQYAEIGHKWADLDAAANILEDTKSSRLSQLIQERLHFNPNEAFNKAEMAVKASQEWVQIVHDTVEARRMANHARVEKDVIQMKSSEQMSNAANERIVAKL